MTLRLRDSGADLPSLTELLEILKNESSREAVHFDYLLNNSHIFDSYKQLVRLVGLEADWIDEYATASLQAIVTSIGAANKAVTEYIALDTKVDLYEKVYESLVPTEDTEKSEALFVFGAATNARIERAIELYKEGVAPKIIISGNHPFYTEDDESEALRMSKFAVKQGIPESVIITEDKSITVPDNVKRTIDLLEDINWKPSSITIIATDFVLQRAAMNWYKFTPWSLKVRAVAAHPQSMSFTKQQWYKDPKTIALVLNEYAKLIFESKIDLMRRDKDTNYG